MIEYMMAPVFALVRVCSARFGVVLDPWCLERVFRYCGICIAPCAERGSACGDPFIWSGGVDGMGRSLRSADRWSGPALRGKGLAIGVMAGPFLSHHVSPSSASFDAAAGGGRTAGVAVSAAGREWHQARRQIPPKTWLCA